MTTTTSYRLTTDADLTHEDARDWYGSYGWHISTEDEGDITLDAVAYDDLDGTDEEVIADLRETYESLTLDEAESIVEKARSVREAAESVESLLLAAVAAYEARDLAGVVEALDDCERVESEHGDSPAQQSLRSEMLEEVEIDD